MKDSQEVQEELRRFRERQDLIISLISIIGALTSVDVIPGVLGVAVGLLFIVAAIVSAIRCWISQSDSQPSALIGVLDR